jgi:hypothetical protein
VVETVRDEQLLNPWLFPGFSSLVARLAAGFIHGGLDLLFRAAQIVRSLAGSVACFARGIFRIPGGIPGGFARGFAGLLRGVSGRVPRFASGVPQLLAGLPDFLAVAAGRQDQQDERYSDFHGFFPIQ